ncbi:MAG: hypothetical protein WCC27_16655 [Acidobacteriaceae bacterium]
MNWKLVFLLSLFGLAMGIGTVFFISSKIEPYCWLAIFLICAWIIARAGSRAFLIGFFVGIVNSIWITACHVLLFNTYIANHPQEAAMLKSMPAGLSPKLVMSVTGPMVGVISGAIIGLLAFLGSKLMRKPSASAA